MALTTGQGRTLRKYTIEKDLAARKSDMILEVGHEMLWGKDPQTLVKASISMLKDLLAQYKAYGSQIRVISVVVWSGNELCGERGIEPLDQWGQRDPKGDVMELLDRVKGNLVWWNKQLKDLGVDQAALVGEPDALVYCLGPIFTGGSRSGSTKISSPRTSGSGGLRTTSSHRELSCVTTFMPSSRRTGLR